MFYALRPVAVPANQVRCDSAHIMLFFSLAAGWGTLLCQSEVTVIRQHAALETAALQASEFVRGAFHPTLEAGVTLVRMAEAVQRPANAGYRFKQFAGTVSVLAVYSMSRDVRRLFGYELHRVRGIERRPQAFRMGAVQGSG